jgi:glycosyltransferase involved in cell wall biosynthesis
MNIIKIADISNITGVDFMASDQESMRILFLLPDFPYPPSTGGRLKVFNELVYLSERHQCDILCFGNPENIQKRGFAAALPKVRVVGLIPLPSSMSKLVGMVWNLIRGLPPSLAAFSGKSYALAVKNCLLVGNYDVVHYDIVNMAQYQPLGAKLPSVHSPNDATSLVYLRVVEHMAWSLTKLRLLISTILLRRFERRMYPSFSKVHVVSTADAEYLKRLDSMIDVSTIPITIDGGFLVKVQAVDHENNIPDYKPKIICTGNLGNMAIAQGVEEFLQNAFPFIVQKIPAVQLIVLGQNINPSLRQKIAENANVKFCTWVDDYRSFLTEADVVLVPDCAGPPGAKTRAVQAMGLGLPVVGTVSAFDGIPLTDGEHALVYRSMHECAESILKLLNNRKMREMLGESAHRLATGEFALSAVGPKYESLYRDAITKHKSLLYNADKA